MLAVVILTLRKDDALCQIDGPRGQILSLVFLADGKRVVCACKAEKTIRMWNIEGHGEEQLMNLGVSVNAITSSKDGNLIVAGGVDGKVVVWDTSLQKSCEAAERHGRMITALDVSSLHVASGSSDGTILVWKLGEPGFPPVPGPLMHHDSFSVSSVKFSPAGSHIASACAHWGCSVKIWNARTGHQLAPIRIDGSPTHSLAWSSDGRRLFAGCSNGSISSFDTVTQKSSKVVEPRPGDDAISSLRISNSDQFLVSFSAPGRTVDIWDIRNTPACTPIRSYNRCVSASISPDDLYLASSGIDRKISIRSLSKLVEASYFFHRLAPLLSDSEPFTYVSPAAYRAWKVGELQQVEHILSREIEDKRYQHFVCYARANRALVRVRRGDLNGALDDAGEAIGQNNGAQIPPIAHIAKAMAFIGQGKRTETIAAFASVHHGDAKNFVECVKFITLFELELRDKLNHGTEVAEFLPLEDACSCPWVKTRKLLLLVEHYMQRGEYNEGLRLLAKAPDLRPFLQVPEAKTLPLVFGWDIYDLVHMVQHLMCQALFASGRTQEVMNFLQMNDNHLDEENELRKADLGWICEKLGDEAMCRKKYDDAITWYSVSLDLCPEARVIDCGSEFAKRCFSAIDLASDVVDEAITEDLTLMARYPPGSARLLVKRSKARAFKQSWQGALEDANQAIDMDKLCPWGYERRYVALRALRRYREATEILDKMVTKVEESADPSIRQLRSNYAGTIKTIEGQIKAICEISPLVLIDVKTGNLCDATARVRMFKADDTFHELVSSMSTELDSNRIKKVVARYFRYVMFSHTWEGKEPTFQDLSEKSVYELDPHPLKHKLRCFYERARDDPEGYLWAWSDTCCIDKTIETVYRKSIRSMFNWYRDSALTIILLARAPTSSTLKNNRWMTRAWTLQELLAPKSVRFYDRDWKLYGEDTRPNHKESPDIMRELAEAVDVTQDTLVDFSPHSLSIRTKLRLASTREATEKADIAYALIGIFSSDLIPEYRDPEDALGLLLQEIVHREGDAKAVLDWVGKSSQFNSCLPAQISAYQNPPYTPPPIPENEMEARAAKLQVLLPQRDVTMFFESLSALGSIGFTHRRLTLPCIIFSVSVYTARNDEASSASSQNIVCQAQATALCQFQFKTSCTAFTAQSEVVLVYPWIRELLAQTSRPEWDNYTRALRLVVHLEHPFRALLLMKQSVDTYKRVATDEEILIPRREVMSLTDIGMKVLEIR
ncbi:hypothetical protein F5J12DRAFT_897480 [Pisolithus orientalis]|uniref:uncharacterized protein n=1 Tax=Pisolithus orientalis TaxID=936130 RepID=UPI0022251398|nr:uncharacterized protein F5J12DRAFT_897480 [Pisolithus orientalis]KAI5991684.1 hypothetical protein F5J12DRAFT_897480 [Pisolithus orientalis]